MLRPRWLAIAVFSLVASFTPMANGQADVIVGDLQSTANWGHVGDTYAYSVGTTSCNIGDVPLLWYDSTNQHPVIGQEMYKAAPDGSRFQQVGISWLKHGFCALSQSLCGSCSPTSCATLGVGCSDPYTASRNGQQYNLGPRSQVNPYNGYYPYPWSAPSYSTIVDRRLQVNVNDVNPAMNPGYLYFVSGHYVTQDDAPIQGETSVSGGLTSDNNASYRRVTVGGSPSNYAITPFGLTVREKPAIFAWRDVVDSNVVILDARDPGEGLLYLGYNVTDNGDGSWHYEYMVFNLNSHKAARLFSLPVPAGTTLTNVEFVAVPYHSGEPYDSTAWDYERAGDTVQWSCPQENEDANANAMRWSRGYTFRFDADSPPADSTVAATIGAYRSPYNTWDVDGVLVPGGEITDCNDNGLSDYFEISSGLVYDCNSNEIPDECDIAGGLLTDANGDGLADECGYYTMWAKDASGATPGSSYSYMLVGTFPEELQGYSGGVYFDSALLQADDVSNTGTVAESADFWAPNVGTDWATFACLVDLSPPIDTSIPASVDAPIANLQFTVDAGATEGDEALVEPDTEVGTLSVEAVYTIDGGVSVEPTMLPGIITVGPGVGIVARGNANGDAAFDIADPVFVLAYMFSSGPSPLCEDAADMNDDGALDIADPVQGLATLFSGAGPLPAPAFPDCGVDPTADSLGCDTGVCP